MDKKPGAMKGVKKPAHPALGTKFIDRKTQRLRIPANKPVK